MDTEPTTHELKTWPAFFDAIKEGRKRFEARENDRGFEVGDTLHLREYDPTSKAYSGRTLEVQVTYIVKGPAFGIEEGYCVMSITAPAPQATNN